MIWKVILGLSLAVLVIVGGVVLFADVLPLASHAAPATSPTTQAPASPVSQAATVTGSCIAGLYDETSGTFIPLSQYGTTTIPSGDEVSDAYQMTLTDTSSSATANVNGFAVTFNSEAMNAEVTSDQESVESSFIEPGQSLTWTEHPWQGYYPGGGNPAAGPFAAGTTGAIDPTITCSLVQWYHP